MGLVRVEGQAGGREHFARSRMATGSLSTSTPSQSKMNEGGGAPSTRARLGGGVGPHVPRRGSGGGWRRCCWPAERLEPAGEGSRGTPASRPAAVDVAHREPGGGSSSRGLGAVAWRRSQLGIVGRDDLARCRSCRRSSGTRAPRPAPGRRPACLRPSRSATVGRMNFGWRLEPSRQSRRMVSPILGLAKRRSISWK